MTEPTRFEKFMHGLVDTLICALIGVGIACLFFY
jgi:hypothetical protein